MHFPLLAIEAATSAGSVALFVDENRAFSRAVRMGASREDQLMPAIDELCRVGGVAVAEIRAVACGEGPGSFTSLRISAAIAKGIAHANNVHLYAFPSLGLAAASARAEGDFLVHSDAMRGERFVQRVSIQYGRVTSMGGLLRVRVQEFIETLPAALRQLPRLAVVSGAIDASDIVVEPHAANVLRIEAWQDQRVDLHAWEPNYGRLAEAQVKWEAQHGTSLPAGSA